jgi:hypothetical protein
MKHVIWIAVFCLAVSGLVSAKEGCFVPVAGVAGAATAAPTKAPGYQLLDGLANIFMVPYGNESEFQGRVDALMKQLRLALEQKEIPLPFYTRFHRMLGICRLVTIKDPEGVLKPAMQAEIDDFVQTVVGVEPGSDKLPHIALALEEEIVNLQIYLDTLPARQAMLDALKRKLPPPPPAKK